MTGLLAVGEHGHLELGFSVGPLLLRVIVLAAVPVVAAFAFLRGFLGEPSRSTTVAVALTAATAATMELLLSGRMNLPEQVIPLLLAALALPMYLVLSRDLRFARAVGLGRRLAPLVFAVTAVLAFVQFGLAALAGRDRATTLLHTGVLLGLVALVWFAIARPTGRVVTMATRVGAAVLGVALLAATAQAITMRPPDPAPGVATKTTLAVGGADVDVLVVPNLPGWNLVHVSSPAAVGTSADDVVAATRTPGATGGWAAVELPAGRGVVWVENAGGTGSFATDTGTAGAASDAFASTECTGILPGRTPVSGMDCAPGRLAPTDADTLRTMVNLLAEQGHDRVAVAGDRSPRGVEAVAVVRAEALAQGVDLVAPGTERVPLLVVSGWPDAGQRLTMVARGDLPVAGIYLAPWLLPS